MEIYKQIAFGRSFSVLHWIHHLVILAALPWYYKYFKVAPDFLDACEHCKKHCCLCKWNC